MVYLLIAFILAIILSPLMWFRQSPRQKLVTDMRKEAAAKGMRVKLSKPADAREGEGRLEYVTYRLPWVTDSSPSIKPAMEKWLLIRDTRRGDPSPWPPWQWLGQESNEELNDVVGIIIKSLPKDVVALEVSKSGVLIFWQERGQLEDIAVIYHLLNKLRIRIRD
jgi:hypothetical protein